MPWWRRVRLPHVSMCSKGWMQEYLRASFDEGPNIEMWMHHCTRIHCNIPTWKRQRLRFWELQNRVARPTRSSHNEFCLQWRCWKLLQYWWWPSANLRFWTWFWLRDWFCQNHWIVTRVIREAIRHNRATESRIKWTREWVSRVQWRNYSPNNSDFLRWGLLEGIQWLWSHPWVLGEHRDTPIRTWKLNHWFQRCSRCSLFSNTRPCRCHCRLWYFSSL